MRNWHTLPDVLHKYDVEIFLISIYALFVLSGDVATVGRVAGLVGALAFSAQQILRRRSQLKELDSNSHTV